LVTSNEAVNPDAGSDEAHRRRTRTQKYLSMWGVPAELPLDVLAPPVESSVVIADVATVRGRALGCCVIALRGQGLSLIETFAFADAYEVWDHFTVAENDFILTEEPTGAQMLQAAWNYERLWVHLWALGLVRHLAFSDTQVDSAAAIETCISGVATVVVDELTLRPVKELLDGADVAVCSAAIVHAAKASGQQTMMNPSVVHERALAFAEVITATA
jgi:Domain of unknown function (DUF4272)